MRVLVTGGAGYIGSHILSHLRADGHTTAAYDNLYSGHAWAVGDSELIVADLADLAALDTTLARGFDAVVHCAGHIWVGESMRDPAKYYRANAMTALGLFDACVRHGIKAVVFSSTAAVYGEPETQPIDETSPLRPINPHGAAKMMAERMLQDLGAAHGLGYGILRYFNVAGADQQARIGEATPDNSHLIKVALETAIGLRPAMRINGLDYPTPDGTCVRDFVHVDDLARAHVLALEHLTAGGRSFIANCGYGSGYSVRQVLDSVRKITGRPLATLEGPRRPGDPPVLVAKPALVRELLGWQPAHADLDHIVRTAWAWELALEQRRAAG